MANYWQDFERMTVRYGFEAFNDHSGFSEGEQFEDMRDAMRAFEAWTLEENGAADAKRLYIAVCVPTSEGELDTFATFDAITERYGEDTRDVYSITEAAGILGISRQRVHQLLQAGKLDGYKVGNTWSIYRYSVESWLS